MMWQRVRTDQLIDKLVADLRPAHADRLIRCRRAWFAAVTVAVLPLFLILWPLRADMAFQLADEMFTISMVTSATVPVAGLLTLFILNVWRCSGRWLLVPVLAFSLWLISEFASIAIAFSRDGWRTVTFESSPDCLLIIGIIGIPIFIAAVSLSRAPLMVWRGPTVAIAALSAFSLPATALNLFHDLQTAVMVLLWHFGAIAVLSVTVALMLHYRMPRILHGWLAL